MAEEDRDLLDYDSEHYTRALRDTFAARVARAFTPDDYAAEFAGPDQLTLFAEPLTGIRRVLTPIARGAGPCEHGRQPHNTMAPS